MKENHTNLNINVEDDRIDIIPVLKKIWNDRIFVLKATLSFFIIGCIIAFLSPVEYTSETTFVPQVSDDQIGANSNLGSIASLAGISLNSANSDNDSYLSPLLYSKIIESEEFSLNLIDEKIIDSKGVNHLLKEYILDLKSDKINYQSPNDVKNTEELNGLDGLIYITEIDFSFINMFKRKFSIELNEKEGYIKVYATDKDPLISSQIVNLVTKNLQQRIINLRTNKIKERLDYSEKQYNLKKKEFEKLQITLADFNDSNKNISTQRFMAQLKKIESEYSLQENVLLSLASEYNNNKIKLNKDTPIFSVLNEISVPVIRTKPNRILITVTYTIFGILVSIAYLLFKIPIIEFAKKFKKI